MVQRYLHPLVQHLFHLVGIVVVHRGCAQGVADQVHRLMVGLNARVTREDRRVCRVFDMPFQGDGVGAGQADQFEQQAQQIAVIGRLPSGALEDLADVAQRLLDRAHVVRDQEGADRSAADHDHLERQGLQDDAQLAPCQQVAAEDHDEDDGDTDEAEHGTPCCLLPALSGRDVKNPSPRT